MDPWTRTLPTSDAIVMDPLVRAHDQLISGMAFRLTIPLLLMVSG